MARFTKTLRQQIVRDFAIRHNGQYNPALFVEEVRTTGPSHPAYEWFEWDQGKAALRYQVEQAREFARDLRVVFSIQEVGGRKSIRVKQSVMPMVLSPVGQRDKGGGYFLTDPSNPDHMAEHCRQAANALEAWLGRYRSAVEFASGSVKALEGEVGRLRAVTAGSDKEAA